MLARQIASSSITPTLARRALILMNFGNVFLPLTLISAAFFEPLKYLMSLPALAVTMALVLTATAAVQDARGKNG